MQLSERLKDFLKHYQTTINRRDFSFLFTKAAYYLSLRDQAFLVEILKDIAPEIFKNVKNLFNQNYFPDVIETPSKYELDDSDIDDLLLNNGIRMDIPSLKNSCFRDIFNNSTLMAEYLDAISFKPPQDIDWDEMLQANIDKATLQYSYDDDIMEFIIENGSSYSITFSIYNVPFTIDTYFIPYVGLGYNKSNLLSQLENAKHIIETHLMHKKDTYNEQLYFKIFKRRKG